MKKIFTVLLAVALTSAVCAQSLVKKGRITEPKTAKTVLDKSMIKDTKATPYIFKNHQAPKDGAAVVDGLTAFNFSSYTGNTGDWEFLFILGENLVLDAPAYNNSDEQIAGVYNIDTAYYVNGADTVMTTGTITLTYASDNGDGTYVYEASANLVTFDGADSLVFTNNEVQVVALDYLYFMYYQIGYVDYSDCIITLLDAPLPTDFDTINMTFTVAETDLVDFTATQGIFQLYGLNENHMAYMAFYSNTVAGTFDSADVYYAYTSAYLADGTSLGSVYDASATVTATEGGYDLNGIMFTRTGKMIVVSMSYTYPVAEDTITITGLTNVTFNDYSTQDGSYQFIGYSDDEENLVGVNYFSGSITGSFTFDDCDPGYSGIYYQGNQAFIYSGNFTVSQIDGGYNIEGYFLCTDNHVYHFNFNYGLSAQGVSNVEIAQVRVYPNPFSSKLNVEADGVQEIQVIDMMGQVVARQANAGVIDMSAMSNGAYIVRTVTEKGVSTQKVIKK